MKVQILQENLNRALNLVSRVVPSRPSLPVLGNILLEAKKKDFIFSATNLEVGMVLKLKAKVLGEGSISVPSRLFAEFIANLPPGDINLELQEKILKISTQTHQSVLNGIDAGEFPPMPQAQGESVLEFKAQALNKAIEQVVFAASSDETRQVLTGALVYQEKEKLIIVATDGFRLSHRELPSKKQTKSSEGLRLIIPARGLSEVGRVLREKDFLGEKEEVRLNLTQDKNQVIFELEGAEISSRLLEDKFPDFKKIIPKDFVSRIIVDREELVKAVKVSSIFARDDANIVHFSLYPKENKLKIAAQTKELGGSETEIEGSLEGEVLEIAYNAGFVLDALQAIGSSQVSMEFSGNLSPTQIKAVGDKSFFHILMPIRTESGS